MQTAVPTRIGEHPSVFRDTVAIVLGGVVLGVVDLWAQHVLPYPFADLANSAAVWAVAAFAVGLFARRSVLRSAALGAVLLVVGVGAYYAGAAVFSGDRIDLVLAPTTMTWFVYGVAAGAIFGVAGAWVREANVVRRCLGVGAAPAVLFAEAVTLARRGYVDWPGIVALDVTLGGLVLVALILRYTDRRLEALGALLACGLTTLVGVVAYTGYGYL